jgi:hypothetical protein
LSIKGPDAEVNNRQQGELLAGTVVGSCESAE